MAQNSLRFASSKEDVWNWLLYGLDDKSTRAGPFSPGANVAEWNHVLGAVRLRQVRVKGEESPDEQGCYSQILSTAAQSADGARITGPLTPADQCFELATPENAKVSGQIGLGNKLSANTLESGLLPERDSQGLYSYRTFDELATVVLDNNPDTTISAGTPVPWGYISGEYGTYDMGGYAVDLPAGNAAQANAILRQLKQDEWLGESVQGKRRQAAPPLSL